MENLNRKTHGGERGDVVHRLSEPTVRVAVAKYVSAVA